MFAKTEKERAADRLLELLQSGPMDSDSIRAAMQVDHFSESALKQAKTMLIRDGKVRSYRPGARTNPYFLELCDGLGE